MNETNYTLSERYPLLRKTMGTAFTIPGVIGIPANLMIILAVFGKTSTIKKTTCTLLLGTLATQELLCSLHYFQCGIGILVGWLWLPQIHCYLTQIPYIFSFHSSSFMMLNIAVDRWLSLQFPIKYRNFNRKAYLTKMNAIAFTFGFFNIIAGGLTASTKVIVPICSLTMALNEWAVNFWVITNLMVNFLVVITYTAAYLRVRISGLSIFKDESHMKKEKQILNSMLILGVVYTCCWLTPVAVIFAMTAMKVSPSVFLHGSLFIGTLASVNACCNFFVYFIRSKEYNAEFLRLMGKKNVVFPAPIRNTSKLSSKPNLSFYDRRWNVKHHVPSNRTQPTNRSQISNCDIQLSSACGPSKQAWAPKNNPGSI